MTEINVLAQRLKMFAAERDWERFHTPKNLAMAMMVEAGELMEHFQWLTEAESETLSTGQARAVKHELADVFIYLIRLADRLNVDLIDAAQEKMTLNAIKYPAGGLS